MKMGSSNRQGDAGEVDPEWADGFENQGTASFEQLVVIYGLNRRRLMNCCNRPEFGHHNFLIELAQHPGRKSATRVVA
jgi:hypothetical protein